jgi:hypothetical protein
MEDRKRPCNNFFKSGSCLFKDKCTYSHTITNKFVQSIEIANVLKKMGLEIKKIDLKPKKEIDNAPNFNSEVDFPTTGKKKTLVSQFTQTEEFAKSEASTATQTEIYDDLDSIQDNRYGIGYNDGISDLTEKVIGDLLHRQDTLNIMGNNAFVHLYFCSNIKSISDALMV